MAGFFDDFATGFAAGFVPAYDASVKRTEARKETEFKTALQAWQDQLKNYNSSRAEDAEYLRNATDVVTELGVSPAVIPNVYNWLRQGRTMENIREDLTTGRFTLLNPQTETTADVAGGNNDTPFSSTSPDASIAFQNDAQASVEGAGLDSQTNAMLGQPINFVYTDYAASQGRSGDPREGQTEDIINAVSNAFKSLNIESVRINSGQRGPDETNHNGNAFDIDVSQYGPEQRAQIITALSENGIRGIGVGNNTIHADVRGQRNRFWWYDANGEETGTMPESLAWSRDAINAHFDRTVETDNQNVNDPQNSSGNGNGNGNATLSAANERTVNRLIETLGISRERYDQVMRGYTPTSMAMTMGFTPAAKPEDTPNWKDLSNVRVENWKSYEAEALAQGDPVQAGAIRVLGQSLEKPDEPPAYTQYTSLTESNAEAWLLAAQRDGHREAIDHITQYMATTAKFKDWDTLTTTNMRGRLISAQLADDQEAVTRIAEFIFTHDNQIPDRITKDWVAGRFTRLALAASGENASPAAQAALQVFRNTELPIFIEAMRLIPSTDTSRPTTLIEAYDTLRDLKAAANPDQEAIRVAEERIDQLLNIQVANALARDAGEQKIFINVAEDGTFQTTVGYVRPGDRENPNVPRYVDEAGQPIGEGYRIITQQELDRGVAVVQSLSIETRNYGVNKRGALRAVRLAGDLVSIVQDEERVLTGTANFALRLNSVFREVNTFASVAGDILADRESITLNEYQTALRDRGLLAPGQTLESLANQGPEDILSLGNTTERVARQTAIFNAKILLMAFRSGGLEGQSGQAMSNKDFDRLSTMINASSDADTFSAALVSYVNDSVQSVRDEWNDLNNHPSITAFVNSRPGNWNPLGDGSFGVSIDTEFSSDNIDDRLKRGVEVLNGNFQLIPPRGDGSSSSGDATIPEWRRLSNGMILPENAKPLEEALGYLRPYIQAEGTDNQISETRLRAFINLYGIDNVPPELAARAQTLVQGN